MPFLDFFVRVFPYTFTSFYTVIKYITAPDVRKSRLCYDQTEAFCARLENGLKNSCSLEKR